MLINALELQPEFGGIDLTSGVVYRGGQVDLPDVMSGWGFHGWVVGVPVVGRDS